MTEDELLFERLGYVPPPLPAPTPVMYEDFAACAATGCEDCLAELEDSDHSHDDDWTWND